MKKTNKHSLNGLLAFLLFSIFAICVLLVLLTSADAYQKLTNRDQSSYDSRTTMQYIITRVHQADQENGVSVGKFGDSDSLELTEWIEGKAYVTRVYCKDGYIWELFTAADNELAPEDGEKIMQAMHVSFSLDGALLTAEFTNTDGTQQTVSLSLRSGEDI